MPVVQMGEKLIKDGNMYVDDTPQDIMKQERMDGIESKMRNNTVEQNLALWKEMLEGTKRGCECCTRFKFDMVRGVVA